MFENLSRAMRGNQNARKKVATQVASGVAAGTAVGVGARILAKGTLDAAKVFKRQSATLAKAVSDSESVLKKTTRAKRAAEKGILLAKKELNDSVNPIFGLNRTKFANANKLYKAANDKLLKAQTAAKNVTAKIAVDKASQVVAKGNARTAVSVVHQIRKHSKPAIVAGLILGANQGA